MGAAQSTEQLLGSASAVIPSPGRESEATSNNPKGVHGNSGISGQHANVAPPSPHLESASKELTPPAATKRTAGDWFALGLHTLHEQSVNHHQDQNSSSRAKSPIAAGVARPPSTGANGGVAAGLPKVPSNASDRTSPTTHDSAEFPHGVSPIECFCNTILAVEQKDANSGLTHEQEGDTVKNPHAPSPAKLLSASWLELYYLTISDAIEKGQGQGQQPKSKGKNSPSPSASSPAGGGGSPGLTPLTSSSLAAALTDLTCKLPKEIPLHPIGVTLAASDRQRKSAASIQRTQTVSPLQCLEQGLAADFANADIWIALADLSGELQEEFRQALSLLRREPESSGADAEEKDTAQQEKAMEVAHTLLSILRFLEVPFPAAATSEDSATPSSTDGGDRDIQLRFLSGAPLPIKILQRACSVNPESGYLWFELARRHFDYSKDIAPPTSPTTNHGRHHAFVPSTCFVDGKHYTTIECLQRSLLLAPNSATAWNCLAAALFYDRSSDPSEVDTDVDLVAKAASRSRGVEINGERVTVKDCLSRSLTLQPKFAAAWFNLSMVLRWEASNEVPKVATPSSSVDSLSEPRHATARVGELQYDEFQCLVRCLQLDSTYGKAWIRLGVVLCEGHMNNGLSTAVVGPEIVTPTTCFVHALNLDIRDGEVWELLGGQLKPNQTVNVNGTNFDRKMCYASAITLMRGGKNSFRAWRELGGILAEENADMTFGRKTYTAKECYIRAVSANPASASCWFNLARLLPRDQPDTPCVTVLGKQYSRLNCLQLTVELDPTMECAWHALGVVLPRLGDPEATVLVRGKEYDAKDCLAQCLTYKPTSGLGWFNLGCLLSRDDKFEMPDGSTLTAVGAFQKAVELNPTHYGSWSNLGCMINPGEVVHLTFHSPAGQPHIAGSKLVPKKGVRTGLVDTRSSALRGKGSISSKSKDDAGTTNSASTDADESSTNPPAAEEEGIRRLTVSDRDCFVHALTLNPKCNQSWLNLGIAIQLNQDDKEQKEGIEIGGKRYTVKGCFVEALRFAIESRDESGEEKAKEKLKEILAVGEVVDLGPVRFKKYRGWSLATYLDIA